VIRSNTVQFLYFWQFFTKNSGFESVLRRDGAAACRALAIDDPSERVDKALITMKPLLTP
jgi:hypothetical protein